jgi:hypothetical protein
MHISHRTSFSPSLFHSVPALPVFRAWRAKLQLGLPKVLVYACIYELRLYGSMHCPFPLPPFALRVVSTPMFCSPGLLSCAYCVLHT